MRHRPDSTGIFIVLDILYVCIADKSHQHNGKVECWHFSDQEKFYQLKSYKEDIDLGIKLNKWKNFLNFFRQHAEHKGKTYYEILTETLS